MSGAGKNIWAEHDEFHFVWRKITGDFILQTRAQFVGKGAAAHRKMGVMARASLDAGAPHVNAVVHGDGLTSLQFCRASGATTEEKKSTLAAANVIQLARQGDRFIVSIARFREIFVTTQVDDLDLGAEV